jgi:hypothetical protein
MCRPYVTQRVADLQVAAINVSGLGGLHIGVSQLLTGCVAHKGVRCARQQMLAVVR